MEENYIVIPALEPGPGLTEQIVELHSRITAQIIVIDDGSGEAYRDIFDRISRIDRCVVLRHGKNRGKGQALKTGFRYIRQYAGTDCLVLCTDCDGQHLPEDGAKLLQAAEQNPGTLVLGIRDFSGEDVPWKSRFGNRISSFAFRLHGGGRLDDTQTGFRAFDGSLLDLMMQIPGDRFEYEMRMLLVCAERGIPVLTEKTETIYVNENEGTHFRPVRDSIQVMSVLFRGLGRFGTSSLLCALLDLILFGFFDGAFRYMEPFRRVAAATVTARIVSAGINFLLNRNWVFSRPAPASLAEDREWKERYWLREEQTTVLRYISLCIGVTVSSALSVYAVSALADVRPEAAKILCDGMLFILSYRIQKSWVFAYRRKDDRPYGG